MNAVLNENSDVLYKELQTPIQDMVGESMKKIFAPVQDTVPYADFFLDDWCAGRCFQFIWNWDGLRS